MQFNLHRRIFLQDDRGTKKEADLFVSSSLLQEVEGSFRLHDLLLDYVKMKCNGEDVLIAEAVERQSLYLGRLAVLRGFSDKGEILEGYYALMGLWQKLSDLSGNKKLAVEAYSRSLRGLGDDESTETADTYHAAARFFEVQVGSKVSKSLRCWRRIG